MLTQVKTWGNSQGIRLPHEILKEAKIKSNDFLEIEIPIPSIEEQVRICKAETRKSLSESDRMRLESYDEFKKEINIVHWLNVLQRQEER